MADSISAPRRHRAGTPCRYSRPRYMTLNFRTDRSAPGILRYLPRHRSLCVSARFSLWVTAGRASSSSLCGAVILSSQWSIEAVLRSRDARIPQPHAVRRSAGLPPGSSSMARPKAIRSIAPRRFRSCFSTSRLRDGESLDTGSSNQSIGGDLRRIFISTVFTATRYNQVAKRNRRETS